MILNTASSVRLGDAPVQAVHLGDRKVWPQKNWPAPLPGYLLDLKDVEDVMPAGQPYTFDTGMTGDNVYLFVYRKNSASGLTTDLGPVTGMTNLRSAGSKMQTIWKVTDPRPTWNPLGATTDSPVRWFAFKTDRPHTAVVSGREDANPDTVIYAGPPQTTKPSINLATTPRYAVWTPLVPDVIVMDTHTDDTRLSAILQWTQTPPCPDFDRGRPGTTMTGYYYSLEF